MPASSAPALVTAVVIVIALALAGCGASDNMSQAEKDKFAYPGSIPPRTDPDGPDLVEVGYSPTTVHLGDRVTMRFTITNQGQADAGPFQVNMAVDDADGHFDWPRVSLPGLAAGATIEATFDADVTTPMPIPLMITVDPDNQVQESDESNNVTRHQVPVTTNG